MRPDRRRTRRLGSLKPWNTNRCVADVCKEILRATKRLGRAIWKRWSGCHQRSLVETKIRCLKLLGERVMARDFDRQVAELQVRAALLNCFTWLAPRSRSQCYKTNYKWRQLGLLSICSTTPIDRTKANWRVVTLQTLENLLATVRIKEPPEFE